MDYGAVDGKNITTIAYCPKWLFDGLQRSEYKELGVEDTVTSRAFELLRRSDVHVNGGDLNDLSLTLPDGSRLVVQVKTYRVPPSPSALVKLFAHRESSYLIVTVRPTESLTDAARTGVLNLITLEPASIIISGQDLLPKNQAIAIKAVPIRQGMPAWGRYALIRSLLLASEPLIQKELAECSGISQPAVVKNLKYLDGLVERTSGGWSPTDRNNLMSLLLEKYPGPRGAATYWYGLDRLHEQVREATKYAKEMGGEPLVSGDVAADIYAPWRLPDSATLYVRQMVDFSHAGFSPATKDEATLISVIPEDQTLWRTAPDMEREGLPLVDPLVTLWELTLSDAPDGPEAADHLKKAILSGTAV